MKKLASTFSNMVLSLSIICLVMGAILGLTSQATKGPIEKAETKAKEEALKVVLPEFDNKVLETKKSIRVKPTDKDDVQVYTAMKNGKVVGYAFETFTYNGFSGKFTVMVGIEPNGVIKDYSVLNQSETPGLGAKMQDWFHMPNVGGKIRNMCGVDLSKEAPLVVSKDGGKVDAITASTITSRAFLDAMNRAYDAFKKVTSEGGSAAAAPAPSAADSTAAPAAADSTATQEQPKANA